MVRAAGLVFERRLKPPNASTAFPGIRRNRTLGILPVCAVPPFFHDSNRLQANQSLPQKKARKENLQSPSKQLLSGKLFLNKVSINKIKPMKLPKLILIGIATTGVILAAPAAPTLLLNGDFESPVQPISTFLPVGSVIPGWTVVGTGPVNVDHVNSGTAYWPGDASQFMDLTGNTGGAGIQSDAFSTVAGQTYLIAFDAFNGSLVSPGTAWTGPALSLQASGSAIANFNGLTDLPAGVPEVLTYSFTAASASTTLTFLETSGFDSNASWIDNITITAVPEPTTAAMLVVGFCALGLARRRATKNPA